MRPGARRDALEAELAIVQGDDPVIQVDKLVRWANRNPDSQWHQEFEWDNERAGHAWRCHQARKILAIELRRDDHTPFVVSLSFDRKMPGGGYRPFEEVVRNPNLFGHVLRDCYNELNRVKAKYEFLREFQPVWSAIAAAGKEDDGGAEPPEEAA